MSGMDIDALHSTLLCTIKIERRCGKQDNSAQRCPPTFLGIGSMRCGSTWLYEVLRCHPDIRLSNPKEIGFFFSTPRTMLQHDLEWYEKHFEPPDGGEPKPV